MNVLINPVHLLTKSKRLRIADAYAGFADTIMNSSFCGCKFVSAQQTSKWKEKIFLKAACPLLGLSHRLVYWQGTACAGTHL
jgi:hypothetical protein